MTITRKRKKLVKFSEPYFIAGQVICAKKDTKIESVGDLLNKTVIVIIGTTGEENIKRFAPNALIWAFDDNAKAIKEFETTPADAITTDDSLLLGLASENSNYVILPTRLTKEPYGIAFKKSDTTRVFEKKLNETINNILNDGTLDMIKEKWGVY
jgi:putative glutamine transport system substrate-binding protein